MTRQEARADPGVVTGLLSITYLDAYILIDTGSTYSYILVDFAQFMNKEVDYLKGPIMVAAPLGGSLIAELVYRDCEVLVEGRILVADLIPLPLTEFDSILGMDWLAAHQAHVDCMRKVVTLFTTEGERVCFVGEQRTLPSSIISTLTATKMLRKGCEAYLAHVVATEDNAPSIADIPVVNKFTDVFPEDLPGLPPCREMEFGIDLTADARPISRAPYRMAPTEL